MNGARFDTGQIILDHIARTHYTIVMRRKDGQSDEKVPVANVEKSAIAREIEDLEDTILRLARDRERLPQPLFWSLFNARLRDIKKHKELDRVLRETLGES